MKIWRDFQNCKEGKVFYFSVCLLSTLVLFIIMKSESMFTDFCFCFITVFVVAKSYKKDKSARELHKRYDRLEKYLERIRYDILGNKSNMTISGCFNMEITEVTEVSKCYYYRVFGNFFDAYTMFGSSNTNNITDMLGDLQSTIIKEYDLQQSFLRELKGLKWIILAAVLAIPIVRSWVEANISGINVYYDSVGGNLIRYGVWTFTILIFMLFDRLGEMKSE